MCPTKNNPLKGCFLLEAPIGIEPMNQSFADSCLTAWLRRHFIIKKCLEQVTGIGPVTKPWQGLILPLNYTCISDLIIITKYLRFVKTISNYFCIIKILSAKCSFLSYHYKNFSNFFVKFH